MIGFTVLLILVAVVIATRWRTDGPLEPAERIFLFAAALPVLLALVLPGVLVSLTDFSNNARSQGLRFTEAGYLLSAAMAPAGILLVVRRAKEERSQDWRVVLALFVAALPAMLAGLVILLYAIR